jgi:hypothetical protein
MDVLWGYALALMKKILRTTGSKMAANNRKGAMAKAITP